MDIGAHIVVRGLVQGVGFRYFVYHHAARLGVKGYVMNLFGGEVEIVAEGPRSMLEELISQVKVGPRSSEVRDVSVSWREPGYQFRAFEIR